VISSVVLAMVSSDPKLARRFYREWSDGLWGSRHRGSDCGTLAEYEWTQVLTIRTHRLFEGA